MPEVEDLRENGTRDGGDLEFSPAPAEHVKLLLPSALPPALRREASIQRLTAKEVRLRIA